MTLLSSTDPQPLTPFHLDTAPPSDQVREEGRTCYSARLSQRTTSTYPRILASASTALGNRILFSLCTCWCMSFSSSARPASIARYVLHASAGGVNPLVSSRIRSSASPASSCSLTITRIGLLIDPQ